MLGDESSKQEGEVAVENGDHTEETEKAMEEGDAVATEGMLNKLNSVCLSIISFQNCCLRDCHKRKT